MRLRRPLPTLGLIAAIAMAAFMLGGCDSTPLRLSGVVSTDGGTVANLEVRLYDPSGASLVASTRTDGNGFYAFRSSSPDTATYLIAFGQPDAGLWWAGATTPEQATPVTLAADHPVTVSPLLPSGAATGVITGESGTPAAGMTVEAIEATTVASAPAIRTTTSTATGSFALAGLPPGSYRLRVHATGIATRYVSDTPTGTADIADATVVTVTAGATVVGNDLRTTAESTITGTVTLGSNPAEGMIVIAVDAASLQPVTASGTVSDGGFSLDGLSGVGYKIVFVNPSDHGRRYVWGSTGTSSASGAAVTPPVGGSRSMGTIRFGEDCQPGYAGADLTGATFIYADFTVDSTPPTGCDLTGTNLTGADLRSADLTNANLTGATLHDAILTSANLTGADLHIADLHGVSSGRIVGIPAALPVGWKLVDGYLVGPGADLTGATFFGSDLSGADLTGADLTGATLFATDVTGADFTGATLDRVASASLVGAPSALPPGWTIVAGHLVGPTADLHGRDLTGADLSGLDLSHADLTGVLIDGANIDGTDFAQATLTGIVSSGHVTGIPAALPPSWQLTAGVFVGPGAYIRDADLPGLHLSGCDLAGARLYSVGLRGAELTDCDLSGADVITTDLRDATLANVDLSGTRLQTANLSGIASAGLTSTVTTYLPTPWLIINGHLVGPGANLAGIDLDGADLGAASLSRVSSGGITGTPSALPADWHLLGGYLIGPWAHLDGADLSDLDLSGLDIHGASFAGATLTGTNLTGTNLQNATMSDIVSGGITGTPTPAPARWMVAGGYLVGPTAVLAGVDLSGLDLSYANLTGTDLTGTDLTNTVLAHAILTNTILEGTALAGADLSGVTSGGITGTPASLPTGWVLIGGNLVGSPVNLRYQDLSGADLSELDLTGADLSHSILRGANLSGTVLHGAVLTGVSSGQIVGVPAALPTGWMLVNGYLVGPEADLTDAVLTGTNLDGANLFNANLAGVTSGGITGTPAQLPLRWSLVHGYLIGTAANLHGADLSGLSLSGLSFGNADLGAADLTGADLHNTILSGADLTDANLTDADLTGAYLNGADLTGATVSGADFTGVMFSFVVSGGIIGTPAALPTKWVLFDGHLIGWGADLTGLDLHGADLTGVDITYATVEATDLSGAILTGMKAIDVKGTPAGLPPDWALIAETLVGPNADVTGANLNGADLSDMNLTGVVFTNAYLWGANLSGSVLTGANLDNTSLNGATLDGVISGGITGSPASLPTGWVLVDGTLVDTSS